MEGADAALERYEALKSAAVRRLHEAQAAAGTAEAEDIIFDASVMTARLQGYVEGLAIDRPALAQDLVIQSRSVVEAIARLSGQAQKALQQPH